MDHHGLTIIQDIGWSIVFAGVTAYLARLLKQPLLLGYIVAGAVLGPNIGIGIVKSEESIHLISEIGLLMLLFIIGLEIRLPDLMKLGKELFLLGVIQFIGSVAIGLLVFQLEIFKVGDGPYDTLYLAVATSISSTLIVVKLLQEKFEIKTVAGRITLGILVFQDLWAILFMGVQPNLSDPQPLTILRSFVGVAGLVVLSFSISKFVLTRLFSSASSSPELVLLTAMAWCFSVAGFASFTGLSLEMGALVAGMSIAAFPQGNDVISKVSGIRDFFITLFFVALGMKVPLPSLEMLGLAALLLVFVFASRIITMVPTAYFTGTGLRAGLLSSLNLSQISEFSLVILTLGAGFAHVSTELQSLVLTAMLLGALTSTYTILFNAQLARIFMKIFATVGFREKGEKDRGDEEAGDHRDIVLLGCYRIAQGMLERLEREEPELVKRILVVDYNPSLRASLEQRGYKWVYGDLAHPESLHHSGIEEASLVICSISDVFLKGITNRRLLSVLKTLAPHAQHIMTCDDPHEAEELKADGAVHVVVPGWIAGHDLYEHVKPLV
jgi:Kef-type K+ transport system membrane component KefB